MNYKYYAPRLQSPWHLPRTLVRAIAKPKWLWRRVKLWEDAVALHKQTIYASDG